MSFPSDGVLDVHIQSLDVAFPNEGFSNSPAVPVPSTAGTTGATLSSGEGISPNWPVASHGLFGDGDHLHGVPNACAEIAFGAFSLSEFVDPLHDSKENDVTDAPFAFLSTFPHLAHFPAPVDLLPSSLPYPAPAARASHPTVSTSSSSASAHKPLPPAFPPAAPVPPAAARRSTARPPQTIPSDSSADCRAAERAAAAHDHGIGAKDRFRCEVAGCSLAFSRRNSLKTHYRKRTGETPYACAEPGCGKKYRWRSPMQHHALTHQRAWAAAAGRGALKGKWMAGGVPK